MRFLSFSILKNCKFKQGYNIIPKRLNSDAVRLSVADEKIKGVKDDPSLVEVSASWPPQEQPELRAAALRDMLIFPDFITEQEESSLMDELEPVLKRMRYEFDHWDNAIHGFRETERSTWRPENEAVLQRVRALAFSLPEGAGAGEGAGAEGGAGEPLPHAHVLDLAPAGHIKPHVDAVRFCGAVIAGLCLCSTAVMRLAHAAHAHLQFDALLPRRGLYIMKGVSRYSFSHAVLGGAGSAWRGERVPRRRRVAVICRQRPAPAPADAPAPAPAEAPDGTYNDTPAT